MTELPVIAKGLSTKVSDADQVAELTSQIAEMKADRWIEAKIAKGYAVYPEARSLHKTSS